MSRIGKKPVGIPDNTSVVVSGRTITTKGPKGELSFGLHPLVSVETNAGHVVVSRRDDSKLARSVHGLTRSLIANTIVGVTQGYERRLELIGTGYRVTKNDQGISMTLGFSHPVNVTPPQGITFDVEGNTMVIVRGANKQVVGQTAANIRAMRPPEPYKGKGIRYVGEYVRRKPGKQAKVGATP
jgi:large subunit ribosomal protein L6